MTRQHFAAIAYALREAYAIGMAGVDIASDAHHSRTCQFETDVLEVAAALRRFNPRFDTHRFLQAAGCERRPDGSQYPTAVIR
jgi:hypothetical protein